MPNHDIPTAPPVYQAQDITGLKDTLKKVNVGAALEAAEMVGAPDPEQPIDGKDTAEETPQPVKEGFEAVLAAHGVTPMSETPAEPAEGVSGGPTVGVTSDDLPKPDKVMTDDEKNQIDFDAFKTMPFIELYKRHDQAKQSIADLESSKKMLDQIGDLSKEPVAAGVNQADAMNRAPFKDEAMAASAQDFYDRYPALHADAVRVEKLLAEMIASFPLEQTNSTTFISHSMEEATNIRSVLAEGEQEKDVNHKLIMQRLEETRRAYANRTDYTFLLNKLRYPNNVLKILKDFRKIDPAGAMKYINKVFMPMTNDGNMAKFRKACSWLLDQLIQNTTEEERPKLYATRSEVVVFFLTYWLARIYDAEVKTGRSVYVRIFVMNVYDADPSSGIYDLEGGIEYLSNVLATFFTVMAFIMFQDTPEKRLAEVTVPLLEASIANLTLKMAEVWSKEHPKPEPVENTSLAGVCPDLTYGAMKAAMMTKAAAEVAKAQQAAAAAEAVGTIGEGGAVAQRGENSEVEERAESTLDSLAEQIADQINGTSDEDDSGEDAQPIPGSVEPEGNPGAPDNAEEASEGVGREPWRVIEEGDKPGSTPTYPEMMGSVPKPDACPDCGCEKAAPEDKVPVEP